MTELQDEPVLVNASPLTEMALSNLRIFVLALGAFAAGRGWFSDQEVAQFAPAILVIAPWLWGQYSRFRLWLKTKVLAELLPDRLARVE